MPSLCTLGIGLVAAILTTIAFLIDVIVVAIIRHRVNDETDGQLQLTWGNAVRGSYPSVYHTGLFNFI